jgi:hypothetical protein
LIDLSKASVIALPDRGCISRAADMLIEEVERRTQLCWQRGRIGHMGNALTIILGEREDVDRYVGGDGHELAVGRALPGAEGYRIQTIGTESGPAILVAGTDARGVLFGVGRLLRLLRMERGRVELPEGTEIHSAPRYPIRGHQLGYRPKTNSYDGWSLPVWEQYIRDLIVFGTNAVELIPPRSDDDADSPHFPLPPMEMMVGMSRILADYGLDVWIWYPAMDADYGDPATVEAALAEWEEVFRQLPRVDHVFVPGGDPGHTPPRLLMALLEKQSERLKRHHPNAGMWMSPQGFDQAWLDEFLELLRQEEPDWLSGVVYGPQIRIALPELRAALPVRYPIRRYPDITHSRHCQYPVPDWDPAFARTEGREGINPRPLDQARIFRLYAECASGFVTYSEGCNDDVNKFVWSALGWDSEADVIEVLREYGRYFIGDSHADDFAQGLLALERNWQGPLLTNESVETTLSQFQAMERSASPQMRANWRFQQALYRAYYDAYIRSRLLYETHLEDQAMEHLRRAEQLGAMIAMNEAEALLDRAVTEPVAQDLRARVFELAEALFQSIRMQLSVERYQAIATERGANLDTIDVPLNDRLWLKKLFAGCQTYSDEAVRLRVIHDIVNWNDPGPGGYYDDLGNPRCQPHLVRGPGAEQDPMFRQSSLLGISAQGDRPACWSRHALSLYDEPLTMHYTGLDPSARYSLEVVYDLTGTVQIRLIANGEQEIHEFTDPEWTARKLGFEIPAEETANGELTLQWHRKPGLGGNGRGCQVATVMLRKVRDDE